MITLQEINSNNRFEASLMLKNYWKADFLVSKGIVHYFDKLDGFIAVDNTDKNNIKGIITYNIMRNELEIVSFNSFEECCGIGAMLLEKVTIKAKEKGCGLIWVLATNDNCKALRYYQMHGFNIKTIHINSMNEVRKFKEVPLLGEDNIPLLHEIELIKEL